MTAEEARREAEERQRLLVELAKLEAQLDAAIREHNVLVVDLQQSQADAIQSINFTVGLSKSFVPVIDKTSQKVGEVNQSMTAVQQTIIDLARRYNKIKNISTATKNLTQCDDEYQRRFRLYEKFRKVCIGYVVGIDKNIISNEKLRTTLEKNYLANSDYWISHCIMATMLWINDEEEASLRALNMAMSIDEKKSILFFLLVNLRFGRVEAAKQWYDLYMQNLDVNNVEEEWQYLLQAYLYKAFGNDPKFEAKIEYEYKQLFEEVKKYSINYEKDVIKKVFNFADAYPHSTSKEYELLSKYCIDYKCLLFGLSNAEKNIELAKYYNSILETSPKGKEKLSRRIEDILHNLISAYDAEELEILKKIAYNEYVIKAQGDLQLASKMYQQQYGHNDNVGLLNLIFKFAFADLNSNVDYLVRKFAISFLLDLIIKGYREYRVDYKEVFEIEKPCFEIDGCKFEGNENTINESREKIVNYYKENKRKFINTDKKHKTFLTTWIVGLVGTIVTMLIAIIGTANGKNMFGKVGLWIFLVIFMAITIIFILLQFNRKNKLLEKLKQRERESLITLNKLMEELKAYRDNYNSIDNQYVILEETLEKFRK